MTQIHSDDFTYDNMSELYFSSIQAFKTVLNDI